MHILFANTGVQVICVPLKAGRRYNMSQIGYGWQHCRCKDPTADEDDENPEPLVFPYVQWQVIQSHVSKLYLAVDTSLGDPDLGYFCDPTSLAGDFRLVISQLLDLAGEPLQGVPDVEITLRAATATAGEAKPVHLVVDFGNSRTGALLVEMAGEVSQAAEMMPFELHNRYHLDAYDDDGEPISKPLTRWFSSRTSWCNAPYLEPEEVVKKEYYRETVKGMFGGQKKVQKQRETHVRPELFDDISLIRLGREVDDTAQIMHSKGDFRLGLSSPKRYLWAHDSSWLEGAFWYMADPHDRMKTGTFGSKLAGRLLRYLHEDDRDFLLKDGPVTEEMLAPALPVKPQHAPRTLMIAALYEMLCQAYTWINSLGYRKGTSDPGRSREIRSLTMTFPSGMFGPEKERFKMQAQKAINIFTRTLGKFQKQKPALTFSIDEASACHLTYIWAELRMLGQDPRLWFATLARPHKGKKGAGEEEEAMAAAGAAPAGRRRNRARPRPRPGRGRGGEADTLISEKDTRGKELRMACIDIGGGTTDIMIARYTYEPGIDDAIHGHTLHQDGVSIAGDQLVKRLLEKVIVPHFAEAMGLEEEDSQLLFGPEVPKNRGFGSERINWMNRLFVPIAESYLNLAVIGDAETEIDHNDPELVDPAVLESLEEQCTALRGAGYYNLQQDLGLKYDRAKFEDVVHEVFDDLLFDLCGRMVDYEVDVILLAGQPSKLGYIRELIELYVPLPSSRIIPMFNHYAGNWYPYQDVKGHAPGIIVDPKSAVVVGAAIEFMARNGMLPQFKFSMKSRERENTYYWGVMTEATFTIRDERILFQPAEETMRDEWTEFSTIAQRVLIGRKMSPVEDAQATPIYLLKMDAGDRIGQTNVNVRIRRERDQETGEEELHVDSVTGDVAGEPAVLGENVFFTWRTLADERYFLDTGGLDNIEIGAV